MSHKFVCQLSPFPHALSTGRPVHEPSSVAAKKSGRDKSESGFSLKEKILAEDTHEKQKYELPAESDESSIHELIRIFDCQRMEIDHTATGCEQ